MHEVDATDSKWERRHVEEAEIPLEQRKAEARLVYVSLVLVINWCLSDHDLDARSIYASSLSLAFSTPSPAWTASISPTRVWLA